MPTPLGFADCSIFLELQGDPQPFAITHGVQTAETNDPVEVANAVMGAFAGPWVGLISNLVAITHARVSIGQPGGGEDLIVDSDLAPVNCTNAAPPMPQNCAVLVRKNTPFGGRRNRGRVYLPSTSDESVVSATGVIAANQVTAMQTAADAWLSNLETSTGAGDPEVPMVLIHRDSVDPSTGQPIPGTAPLPTIVTSLTVDNLIATQRRRLRR